jgi:hypothetical protein
MDVERSSSTPAPYENRGISVNELESSFYIYIGGEGMQEIQHTESGNCCPAFCDGKKRTRIQQAVLWRWFMQAPARPTRQVLTQLAGEGESCSVSVRHVNRRRAAWGVQRGKGRPHGRTSKAGNEGTGEVSARKAPGALVQMTPSLS